MKAEAINWDNGKISFDLVEDNSASDKIVLDYALTKTSFSVPGGTREIELIADPYEIAAWIDASVARARDNRRNLRRLRSRYGRLPQAQKIDEIKLRAPRQIFARCGKLNSLLCSIMGLTYHQQNTPLIFEWRIFVLVDRYPNLLS